MDIIVDNSNQWDYVARVLTESRKQSNKVLGERLPTLREMIEEDRYGELLLVSDAHHPQQFIGAVAVTMKCCCVKVLMQVVSKDYFDQSVGKQALAQAIKQFAEKYHCTLIFVYIPESGGFTREHKYYEERAESAQTEQDTVTYLISVQNL